MKTRVPNSLGKPCLLICLSVSCILFQFMFFGLIHLYAGNPAMQVPDWFPDVDAAHLIRWFDHTVNESQLAVDVICLMNMPVIIIHLALICYVALRRSGKVARTLAFSSAPQP